MITAASMAGVPLTNGFLSKEMFFTELVANLSGPVLWVSAIVATLAGIFAVAYSIRLVHGVFFDGPIGKNVPNKGSRTPVWHACTRNFIGGFMYFSRLDACLIGRAYCQ